MKQALSGLFLFAVLFFGAKASIAAVDVAGLVLEDARVEVTWASARTDRRTGLTTMTATLTNVSSDPVEGQIYLVIEQISPASAATVHNAPDATLQGKPLFIATVALLGPGASTSFDVQFRAPSRQRFDVVTHVYVRPPPPAVWDWDPQVGEDLEFSQADLVTYVTSQGREVEELAVPGQVVVDFGPHVTLSDAVALIDVAGGALLDAIPGVHSCLVEVTPGEEALAIEALRNLPSVRRAGVNRELVNTADVVVLDACNHDHGEQVTKIVSRCAPQGSFTQCVNVAAAGGAPVLDWLVARAIFNTSHSGPVVLNCSFGPPVLASFDAVFEDHVEQMLDRCLALRTVQGIEAAMVLSAGNDGWDVTSALLGLEARSGSAMYDNVVLVGVPRAIQPSSNRVSYGSPNFVYVDQNRTLDGHEFGTSFAAPRVTARLARLMQEHSVGTVGAMQLLKDEALAAGGVLESVCACVPDMHILADTGTDALSSIDPTIAINAAGDIGFTGLDGTGLSRPYIATSAGSLSALGFAPNANRNYGGAAISSPSSGSPYVLARERVSGVPIGFVLRSWPTSAFQFSVLFGSNVGIFGPPDFDSVSLHVDLNDNGVAVYSGLVGGSTFTRLFMGSGQSSAQEVAVFAGIHSLRPAISNTGRIVVQQPPGGIFTWNPLASIASTSDFTVTGLSPGIATGGNAIAFYGDLTADGAARFNDDRFHPALPDLTAGPGVFASVDRASPVSRDVIRVAGAAQGFTSFVSSMRVGVMRRDATLSTGHPCQIVTVAFAGTRNGKLGIYLVTADMDVFGQGVGLSILTKVIEIGDVIFEDANHNDVCDAGEVRLPGTVADLSFQHPFGKGSNNQIGFWVRTTAGVQAVVRAVPIR
jgi:hypothetical protein